VTTLRRVALLVALWLLAWGELSLANVLSGIAAAAALLVAFPVHDPSDGRTSVRILGAARLLAHVAVQLVLSNLTMATTILRPRPPERRSGVVTYELERPSDPVVTLMTSIIALSPGTMTVDVHDSSTLLVHFFSLDDPDAAHRVLADLERLVSSAIRERSDA